MYNEFAYIYDELMNDFDYENWFNYIEKIYLKNKKNPKKILEMACGTGNLSYFLASAGYELSCFDLSSDMLSVADSKLSKFKNVKLFKQNMINFKMMEKYDSILAICDSINYILDIEDLKKTFKNVFNHLSEGGVFIFDINSYYKLKEIIGDNVFIEDREDMFYSWENYYDKNTNICQFYLNFFVENKNGQYERFIEEHFERAYKMEEIEDMLMKVGFSEIEMYESFSFKGVKEDTERINIVAIK